MVADNSARYLAKQVVSEWVQVFSPFRWERMRAGVCRTMKIENYVPKLHGVGGGDLSASDCLSPLPVAGGDVPGGRCLPEGCSVRVSYAYVVYISIMYTYNRKPLRERDENIISPSGSLSVWGWAAPSSLPRPGSEWSGPSCGGWAGARGRRR